MATKDTPGQGKQSSQADKRSGVALDDRLRDDLEQAPLESQLESERSRDAALEDHLPEKVPLVKGRDSTKSIRDRKLPGNVVIYSNLQIEGEEKGGKSKKCDENKERKKDLPLDSQSPMLNDDDETEELKQQAGSRSQSRGNGDEEEEILMAADSPRRRREGATPGKEGRDGSREDEKRISQPRKEVTTEEREQELEELYMDRRLQQLAIERMLLEEEERQKLLDALAPEELVDKALLGEGQEAGGWRRRKIRQKGLPAKAVDGDESSDANSEMPGQEEADGEDAKTKHNKPTQEKLRLLGDRIPVSTQCNVKFAQHDAYFKYMIYDGYRPQNLAHARDYVDFLVRPLRANADDELNPEYTPEHILDYLGQDIKTQLPGYIDEDKILTFDQNFECGNLDSAYLNALHEYNLAMKVDTNTRGNTYWFMFKVSDFAVNQKYKFNIMNFSRNMDKFYNQGMGPVTRREKKGAESEASDQGDQDKAAGEDEIQEENQEEGQDDEKQSRGSSKSATIGAWRQQTCVNLEYYAHGDLVRSTRRNYDTGEIVYQSFFAKLSFTYTFTEKDKGHTIAFASAIPYGYMDLLDDLDAAKQNMMQNKDHGEVVYKVLAKEDLFDSNAVQKLQAQNGKDGESGQAKKERPRIISPTKVGFGSALKEEKASAQKVNLYEIQHMAIKREGIERIRNNKFEVQYADVEQNDVARDEFRHATGMRNSVPDRDQNFEIQNKVIHYRQEVIGQSMCGLNLYQITLTKKREQSMKHKKKSVIYIQARQHAAETHGSFIMRNILFEFTANYSKYDAILSNYIIKLVPMLNPDGVVIGNSRSSLSGVDLNRRWSSPNSIMHPEIYFMKVQMALTDKQSAGITMFCDLHGHNKHMNTFIYGCNKAPNQGLLSWTKTRLFPKIFASIEPIFNFSMCQFSQEKAKYNTARVVVWNEFKVTNSFTLETSMYGKRARNALKRRKMKEVTTQFALRDFMSIGLSLIHTIRNYISLEKELEEEFKATGGWLRKKKLDEVTGETARQKAEQNNILQIQKLHDRVSNVPARLATKVRAGRSQSNVAAVVREQASPQALAPERSEEPGSAGLGRQKAIGDKALADKSLKKSTNGLKKSKDDRLKSGLVVVQEHSPLRDSRSSLENDEEEKKDAEEDDAVANWKEYFSKDEIDDAIIESKKPIKKDVKGNKMIKSQANSKFLKDAAESDSEPSCDNFDEEELAAIFEVAVSDDEMDTLKPSAAKKRKAQLELKPSAKSTSPNRGDKPHGGMKPKEYNTIVEKIQGVEKETQKLGRRFDLLAQQIQAKILQDQSQYSTGSYPPTHLLTLNDRRMMGPQIGGVARGPILAGLGQSNSNQLLDADFGSAGPKSGQKFSSGANHIDQQRTQQENLKFQTFAPLLRNLLDQNSNQMLGKIKGAPDSKVPTDLNLAYAGASKYPNQNLTIFQSVAPHINGVSGTQGDALQKFIENLTEKDKRNKNQGLSIPGEQEGLRQRLSRQESTYTQDSDVFEDKNQFEQQHEVESSHHHQNSLAPHQSTAKVDKQTTQIPSKALTLSMNNMAGKQWTTDKREGNKASLVETQLSQNVSQINSNPSKESLHHKLNLKKELAMQSQRFVGQRAQRANTRLPSHPMNEGLKKDKDHPKRLTQYQIHNQEQSRQLSDQRVPNVASSFNATGNRNIMHRQEPSLEIAVGNSYSSNKIPSLQQRGDNGSHNYPSSYSMANDEQQPYGAGTNQDGTPMSNRFHYPKGSNPGLAADRKSIGSQQERKHQLNATPRGSQRLQLTIPDIKAGKTRYEDAQKNTINARDSFENSEERDQAKSKHLRSNHVASPEQLDENFRPLPASVKSSQKFPQSAMKRRKEGKADTHTKLPILKPSQVKAAGPAAMSLERSWNGLPPSPNRKNQ